MVAAEHPVAAAAGLRILQSGGNAVDAAVATALAVGVTNPTSCGIGGGGFLLLYRRSEGIVRALDFRETAPAAARRDMFVRDGRAVPELSRIGALAIAVPGEVAGLFEAHRRHGRLKWDAVVRPAIDLARDGFPIERHLAEAIVASQDRIRAEPELAARLLDESGAPLPAGEPLLQPELAATLQEIAQHGPRAFYRGDVARAIVDTVRTRGGILEARDLETYRPVWRPPLRADLHGDTVYSMPPPSSGGGVLLATLELLRRDRLGDLGPDSATYLHLLTEAMKFGFADRAAKYGDPDFVSVPLLRLLSPDRALRRRRLLSAATSFSPSFYGSAAAASDDAGTSHLSVVDGAGNAVALTSTINTSFGSMVIARGTGILLNNQMDDFSAQPGVPNTYGLVGAEANSIAPGKRPLSSMTPTIVLRRRDVRLTAGASGGPFIISATMQTVLNVLVFGRDAASAIEAPRVHHQWLPDVLLVEPGIVSSKGSVLRRLGHRLREIPGIAAVQLVRRAADGVLDGAADPRKGGAAVGW